MRTGTGIRLKEAIEAIAQLDQGAEPSSIVPGPLVPSDDKGAVDDGTDAEVEALFYSNVHAACTAPLRPLGAAVV